MSSFTNEYEEWNLKTPIIPPRSILYSLKPIGVGTPLVECLTSYISRLAEAHCVFPGILIRKLIVPSVQQSPLYKESCHAMTVGMTHSHGFNGTTHKQAGAAIYAFETLTQQGSLRFLTFLTWEEVFPSFRLLRQTRAWCPACLEEWQNTGQTVYEPLLWALQVVTHCVRHQCVLSTCCPNTECERSAPWLAWSSRPGYCPFCCQWLGRSAHISAEEDAAKMAWQQWVTEQLGRLLAVAPTLTVPPSQTRVLEVLEHALQQMKQEKGGGQRSFAHAIKVRRSTYSNWLYRRTVPELEILLFLCSIWRISLYDCIFKDVTTLSLYPKDDVPGPSRDKSQLKKARDFWSTSQVREALEVILTNGEFPPPSLKDVARRLESQSVSLRTHHRELSNAITERYQAYIHTKKQANLQRSCEEVRQATYQIAAEGMRPTRKKLAQVLTKPGILRNSKVREAWQEVLREIDGNA